MCLPNYIFFMKFQGSSLVTVCCSQQIQPYNLLQGWMQLASRSGTTVCLRLCSQLPAASYFTVQANQELCRRQRGTLPEAASCALTTKQTKKSSKQQLFQNLNVSPIALIFSFTFLEELFLQESSFQCVVPLLKTSCIQPYNKLQGWIF